MVDPLNQLDPISDSVKQQSGTKLEKNYLPTKYFSVGNIIRALMQSYTHCG